VCDQCPVKSILRRGGRFSFGANVVAPECPQTARHPLAGGADHFVDMTPDDLGGPLLQSPKMGRASVIRVHFSLETVAFQEEATDNPVRAPLVVASSWKGCNLPLNRKVPR